MALTKVTEGIRTLGTGEVAIANISGSAAGAAGTFLKQDGTWAEAATDTTTIESDIALLGFKVAANGGFGKYNLVDQTEDAFMDATGVDASASTIATRNAANYYSGQSVYTGAGYGFAGGTSSAPYTHAGGGGGGASAVGGSAGSAALAGNGGAGRSNVFRTNLAQVYGSGGCGG